MEKQTIDSILDRLGHSSMFHLSLGSKELFHSNFLYWLSIVDWDVFLTVIHGLANKDCFWWEEDLKSGKVIADVRREFHNYDLSIYIRVSQEEDKDNPMSKQETWIPVFVLENKMKSLPRKDQLQDYTEKAFKEWCKTKKFNHIPELWEKNGITFVLLSLFIDKDFSSQCTCKKYKSSKNDQSVSITAIWEANNYKVLFDCLNGQKLQNNDTLNQQILEDYCRFILALHELAEGYWIISPENLFVKTIYPWAIKGCTDDPQVKLRIDDIRQKVHYAQMEKMLCKELDEANIIACHAKDETNKKKIKDEGKRLVMYNTNFAHNIGILEVSVEYRDDISIFIQLQGNSYAHAFARPKNKNAAKELKTYMQQMEALFEFSIEGPTNEKNERLTDKYPTLLNAKVLYPQGINKQAVKKGMDLQNFKYFGQGFVYQNVLIPETVKIGQVIQAMVEDTKKCLKICSER